MSEFLEFADPQDVPVPKEEVRIRRLAARPYPDGRRVRLDIAVTPFQERPNLEFEALDPVGDSVGTMSVIETMDHEFELTLHLRGPEPRGLHTLRATLSYPEGPAPVTAETTFHIKPPPEVK
ncbi:MAG: hypothetical protein HY260_04035 [Chloroflexi bacterium]|nr:hypothetical protein [Chloroflexota bacterium]